MFTANANRRLARCAPSAAAENWRPAYIPIRRTLVKEFSPIDLSAKLHSCHTGCVADPPSWGVRVRRISSEVATRRTF